MATLTKRTSNVFLRFSRFSEPFTLANLQALGLPPVDIPVTQLTLTEEGDTILTEEGDSVITEDN